MRKNSEPRLIKKNAIKKFNKIQSFRKLITIEISELRKSDREHRIGYIDVGDGCWRWSMLLTSLRCWGPKQHFCHQHHCRHKIFSAVVVLVTRPKYEKCERNEMHEFLNIRE